MAVFNGGEVFPIPTQGTESNDIVNSNGFISVFDALGGNDIINGSGNDEYFDGGEGNDQINGNGGNDTLIGGGGDDRIIADGNSLVDGGTGNDDILLNGGSDTVILRDGDGSDKIQGYQRGMTEFDISDVDGGVVLGVGTNQSVLITSAGGELLATVFNANATLEQFQNDIIGGNVTIPEP
ncbi:hypothetical protein [Calothrix rhizosoleniae]